ncbi:MAG: hypothetical protein HY869_21960 [Chloroflexi bacterium]|nr:hypothetical protein [Chloroflexota bacterium]
MPQFNRFDLVAEIIGVCFISVETTFMMGEKRLKFDFLKDAFNSFETHPNH